MRCWFALMLLGAVVACSDSSKDANPDLCSAQTCGEHQICDATSGQASCVCEPGWRDCAGVCIPQTTECDQDEPECTVGETTCHDAQTLALCDEDGVWQLEACEGELSFCEGGACESYTCLPNAVRCTGPDLYRCDGTGSVWDFVETCMGECLDGVCLDPCGHHEDKISYLGCTFWALNLQNNNGKSNDSFAVTVASEGHLPIDITVYNSDDSVVLTDSVEPGALTSLHLTSLGQVEGNGFSEQSYRLETNGPVTMHQFNPLNDIDIHSSDASLLLPLQALGSRYRILSWPNEYVYFDIQIACVTDGDCMLSDLQTCEAGFCEGPIEVGHSQVTLVGASTEPTTISIDSPVLFEIADATGAATFYEPGTAHDFSLVRGHVLTLSTTADENSDLTGLTLSGDHEFSVFSSSTCAMIPAGAYACDHLEQELIPTNTWGKDYVGAKFSPRGTEPDLYRVLADLDGTLITTNPVIDGIDAQVIDAGEVLEFYYTGHFLLEASNPVSMGQYMVGADYPGPAGGCSSDAAFPAPALDRELCAIPSSDSCSGHQAIGDPAFLLNVPQAQYRNDYTVLVPDDYLEDYLSVVAPVDAEIFLDGVAQVGASQVVGSSGWVVWTIPVAGGVHRITSQASFGLNVYGYDCTVSYAYPGGLNLEAAVP